MIIYAPFSQEQVQYLNERQCRVDGGLPITPVICKYRFQGVAFDADGRASFHNATHGWHGGDLGLMIATITGWECPYCGHQQDWAYRASADKPLSVQEVFRHQPFLAARFPTPYAENVDAFLTGYQQLAGTGSSAAQVMVDCLLERRRSLPSAPEDSRRLEAR